MSKGELSDDDLAALVDLVQRNGADAVVNAVRALGKKVRKVGRPAGVVGNLASVFGYIEFHRRAKGPGGGKLGVNGACAKLRRLLDRWTVNCRISAGRLRTMYYEAQQLAQRDANFKALMLQSLANYERLGGPENMFPVPMIKTEGAIKSVIIDRLGRGGRPVDNGRPKIVQ